MISNIPVVILAGGKNSRFYGIPLRNKAFLKFGKKRIIDLMLDVLKDIFPKIIIVTNKPSDFSEFENVLVVEDIVKNCGSIGGIYTGLKNVTSRSAFFIACDMPFAARDKKIIEKILKISHKEKDITTVPISSKGFEPLFAVYNREIISGLEKAIKKREFSIIKTVKKFPIRFIRLNKKEMRCLTNINTCSDWKKAVYEFRNFKNY
ncbi:MAG: molybdenum cofactor guanylyltransferase [Elusimicrobiota bacterium]|nr:molybdenum cofactor guanylyltransferase [Elusimicrobiota bacterium]